MRGLILSAGFGTRLRPITGSIPKALVPLCGAPALQHKIEWMKECGCNAVGVNTHYLHSRIESFVQSNAYDVSLFHETDRILGTGGALYNSASFCSKDDICVVANVDIVADIDLCGLVARFRHMDALCAPVVFTHASHPTIVYDTQTHTYLGTYDSVNSDERLHHGSGAFIGITLYRPDFFSYLTSDDFSITAVWDRLRAHGAPVKVCVHAPAYWKDIGTPASLAAIHHDTIAGISPLAPPEWMVVDTRTNSAYNLRLADDAILRLGSHTWYEPQQLPSATSVHNSIVVRHARLKPESSIRYSLCGEWGCMDYR